MIAAFDRVEDGPEFSEEDEDMLHGIRGERGDGGGADAGDRRDPLRESIEVAERERARWARELHDETLQGLGALRVRLAASLRHGRPERVDQAVREAIAQIEDEIANLRSLITELRPAALDELGLGAAIESLVESHAAATGLELHLDLALAHEDGVSPNRLDRELESAVYRVVQEALTNVAKHANAESVWIEVAQSAGFAPDRRPRRRRGLRHERPQPRLRPGRDPRADRASGRQPCDRLEPWRRDRGARADPALLDLEHAALERVADQLGALRHAELLLDVRAVRLDRANADHELLSDLGVGVAERDQPQDLRLALAELVGGLGRDRGRPRSG